ARSVTLTALHRDGTRQVLALEPDIAASWRLILPWQPYISGEWTDQLVTALWLCMLIAPFAYWTLLARIRQGPTAAATLLVILVVGLWAVPLIVGFPAASLADWIGAVTGAAVGWVAT